MSEIAVSNRNTGIFSCCCKEKEEAFNRGVEKKLSKPWIRLFDPGFIQLLLVSGAVSYALCSEVNPLVEKCAVEKDRGLLI